jgi:hypothetical protein
MGAKCLVGCYRTFVSTNIRVNKTASLKANTTYIQMSGGGESLTAGGKCERSRSM